MPEPTPQEIARGTVDKPARPPATDTERAAQRLRESLDKAQREGRPPVSAMEQMNRDHDARDSEKSSQVLSSTFDDTLDAETSGGPSLGKDRIAKAADARDLSEAYLTPRSYGRLTGPQKDVIRGQIQDVVKSQPGGNEIIADYTGRGGDELQKFLDRWATDVDFRQTVRDVKREVIDNPPDVAAAQAEIKTAQEAADAKQKELDEVTTKLDEFKPGRMRSGKLTGEGSKHQQMREADAKRSDTAVKTEYNTNKTILDGILSRYGLNYSGNGVVNIPQDMLDRGAIHGGDLREIERLKNVLKNSDFEVADRKFNELSQEQSNLTTEQERLTRERDASNVTVSEAKNARAQMEQDYADRLTNVYGEAMTRFMTERNGVLPGVITEMGAENANSSEAMAQALRNGQRQFFETSRYNPTTGEMESNPDMVRIKGAVDALTCTPESFVINQMGYGAQINPATGANYVEADITDPMLLATAEASRTVFIMRDILATQINPATGVEYTQADISAILAADPDFVKNNQTELAKDVMKWGVRTQNVDAEQMQRVIDNRDFGGMDFVNEVLQDPQVRECVRQAQAEAERNGWMDFMRRFNEKTGINDSTTAQFLIALFLGGPYGVLGLLAYKGVNRGVNSLKARAVRDAEVNAAASNAQAENETT